MDSSNITSATSNTTTNYQEIPLSSFLNLPQPPPPPPTSSSPSPSFFDPLPSYLPTFHRQEPPSSSSSSHPPPPPPSSSKKRPRASRRAPTTVLTTDTSNFRAMVQEFTGFPAPPFSASSASLPCPPRFDHLSSSPYFLPRPFPHKTPAPSSFADAIAAATATAAAYPLANAATSMIGIQNQTPHPQFGNHLITSFAAANSESMQQQQPQQHGRPGWADHDPQDPDDQLQQQEKRRKTSGADGGVVESWLHSSD